MSAFRNACAVATLVIAVGFTNQARADLEVLVTDGLHTGNANDGGTGLAAFSGMIGNFNVAITEGAGFPAVGSPSDPILDLTSLDLTSTAGGTLTVKVTETGFTTTPAAVTFLSDITGNYTSSNATMNTYLDKTDADFGTGTLLSSGLLDNQSEAVSLPSVAGPYSLTEVVTITAGPNSLASIDAAITDAPEPTSLSLLAAALAVLCMVGSMNIVGTRTLLRVRI